jgi:hypothetical protein
MLLPLSDENRRKGGDTFFEEPEESLNVRERKEITSGIVD